VACGEAGVAPSGLPSRLSEKAVAPPLEFNSYSNEYQLATGHWTSAREVFKLDFQASSMKQSLLLNYLEPRISYNSGKSYSLFKWRLKIMERDRECRHCSSTIRLSGRKPVNEAHHIVPRHNGGRNTLSNGIALCSPCHRYFDAMYFKYGMDYYDVLMFKEKSQRFNEIRQMQARTRFREI